MLVPASLRLCPVRIDLEELAVMLNRTEDALTSLIGISVPRIRHTSRIT